jgi:hypothetical protein
MIVAVAGVDEDGLTTGGFSKILEKNAAPEQAIFAYSLEAVEGSDSIMTVVSFVYIDIKGSSGIYGPYKSVSSLIKTDRSGLVTGGISELPLPGNGYLNLCVAGAPYWTGSGWMTAVCNTKMRLTPTPNPDISYATPYGKELYVYTIADGTTPSAAKFRRRLLFKDAQSGNLWTFRNFQFLPSLTSDGPKTKAGASKVQNLFFAHRIGIPYDDQRMDGYTEDYYLTPVNLRGKRAGNSVKIQIPQWDHQMPYDPEKSIYGYSNTISNLIQDDSGRLLAAVTRSTLLGKSAGVVVAYDCEHELSLYRIYPITGAVELLAKKTGGDPVGVFYSTFIRWFNSRIAIINEADVYQPNYDVNYYYTVISP